MECRDVILPLIVCQVLYIFVFDGVYVLGDPDISHGQIAPRKFPRPGQFPFYMV